MQALQLNTHGMICCMKNSQHCEQRYQHSLGWCCGHRWRCPGVGVARMRSGPKQARAPPLKTVLCKLSVLALAPLSPEPSPPVRDSSTGSAGALDLMQRHQSRASVDTSRMPVCRTCDICATAWLRVLCCKIISRFHMVASNDASAYLPALDSGSLLAQLLKTLDQ